MGTRAHLVRGALAVALAAGFALAPAGPAAAANGSVTIAAFTYVSPVTVTQAGASVTVANLDGALSVPHNIEGPNGSFYSPVTTSTEPMNVVGIERLGFGVYPYTCLVHGNIMNGIFVVV